MEQIAVNLLSLKWVFQLCPSDLHSFYPPTLVLYTTMIHVHSKTTCNSDRIDYTKKMYPVFIYKFQQKLIMKKLQQRPPLLAYYSYEKDLTILIPFSQLCMLNAITYCVRLKHDTFILPKTSHSLLIRV